MTAMDTNSHFGLRLRAARLARGMTIARLAREVEAQEREITRYESGLFRPRDERMSRLATSLGVTPAWLVYGEGEGPEGAAHG